jgi:hypothetical protein
MRRADYIYSFFEKLTWILRSDKIPEATSIFLVSFLIMFAFLTLLKVEPVGIGGILLDFWCEARGVNNTTCINQFNSSLNVVEQSLSLALFLTDIALTAISMKLRYFAAILAFFNSCSWVLFHLNI